jgi:tetratricopeptide (TPR) repeat protein
MTETKRREAGVSVEIALPAAALGAEEALPSRRNRHGRKDESLTQRLQLSALSSRGLIAILRTRACTLLLVAMTVVAVSFMTAACGQDLGKLTEEAVRLMTSGRYDEALPIQERIAALDPDDAQIRVELGFNYLNHQNNAGKALAVFKEATDLEPSARNMTFLAQAYIKAGDLVSAESALRAAIETDRRYGHPYSVLVSLLEERGQVAEAAELRKAAESAGVVLSSDNGQ